MSIETCGIELPSAEDLDLPSPDEGMAWSVFPPTREHLEDPLWWDQAGRDIIDQRRIFRMPPGPEQKAELRKVLEEFPNSGFRIMEKAATADRADIILILLELGVSPENDTKMTPIHDAAFLGHTECVQVLIEKGNLPVDILDENSATPLHGAARQGHLDLIEWLLNKGANPMHQRDKGLDIYQCAAASGDPDVLTLLLDRSPQDQMEAHTSLLVHATFSNSPAMVRLVLEREGFPLDTEDGMWKGDLLTEAQRATIEDDCIYHATRNGSEECLRELLDYLTPRQDDGSYQYFELRDPMVKVAVFNALEEAVEFDYADIFKLVWEAIMRPPPEVLATSATDRSRYQEWLHRRLISAAHSGSVNCLRLILEKYGADVNHVSMKYHVTTLFCCAVNDYLEATQYLLENHPVNIHIASGDCANGPTALYGAVKRGNTEMAKLLLKHGGPLENLNQSILQHATFPARLVVTATEFHRAPVEVALDGSSLRPEDDLDDVDDEDEVTIERKVADKEHGNILETSDTSIFTVSFRVTEDDMTWIRSLQIRLANEELKLGDPHRKMTVPLGERGGPTAIAEEDIDYYEEWGLYSM